MATAAATPHAATVAVRGAQGAVGRAVSAALRHAGYVVIDDDVVPADASVLVDAAVSDYDLMGATGMSPAVEVADAVEVATASDVDHVVLLSSAMVYGALPNNPIPLTEDAVLRPDPEFAYATQLAAAEEIVEAWRTATPGRITTVLRPAVPVDAANTASLARALTAGLGHRFDHDDPPAQFVHIDDVATAAVAAVDRRLDGVYNIAPDGWIPGDRLRDLAGGRMRLPLPDRVVEVVSSLRWRFQRGPIPPGLASYIQRPWVVANDKLRAVGWEPTVTNEQAFVEGTEARWWTMVTPKRRQELALGAMAALAVALTLLTAGLIGRSRRR